MKGLLAWIFKCEHTAKGGSQLSHKVEKVTIIDLKQNGVFEPSKDAPAVLLYRRICMGGNMPILLPVRFVDGQMQVLTNTMFGGCYASTSDSRFHSEYPIPIHDRVEGSEHWLDAKLWLQHPHNRQYENLSFKHYRN